MLKLWFSVLSAFSLLPLRTLDEQQQAKPSAVISDASSVATAPTYVDSPRKVSICSMCVYQKELFSLFHLLQKHLKVFFFSSNKNLFKMVLLCLCFGVGLLLLFHAFHLHFSPCLCSVSVAELWVFDPGLCSSCMLTGRCLYFGFYT